MLGSLYHEVGRQLLFRVRPFRSRQFDRVGGCSVCGARVRFRHNSWLIPIDMKRALADQKLVQAFASRESMLCPECLASHRVRRLAETLLALYSDGATSLAELVREDAFRSLRIAEINGIGAAREILARHPQLDYSEYVPDEPRGLRAGTVRNEDIESLSYADETFDLVLTSDTLEHVPNPRTALAETRRVLRPGGRHVLTVPLVPEQAQSVRRATLADDGRVEHHLPAVHHGRGSGPFRFAGRKTDYLVYTDFGYDFLETVSGQGFTAALHGYAPESEQLDLGLVVVAAAASR